jgi:P-type Mg2+ transporter
LLFYAWGNPVLFETGWFVESLLTQTLIIHIRTAKIPFCESRASSALIATGLPLPPLYWLTLCPILASYAILTHYMMAWLCRRFGLV